jgi:hypothetical protein
MSSGPLPSLVPVTHQFPLCIWGPHPDSLGRWIPPPGQVVLWHLVGSSSNSPVTREVTNYHLRNPGNEPPRNVAGLSSWVMGHWGRLAGSNVLLCQHRLSGLVSKGWARERRGLTLCTLASRLQKQKARSNPYMVIYDFIGYFILVLQDFSIPVLRDPLNVQISQVLSLCYSIPTSLLLYQNPGLVCFLLVLLPATVL